MRVLYLTINPNRVSTTVPTEGWFRLLRTEGLEPVLVSHEIGDFHAWCGAQEIPAYHVPLPLPSKWNPLPFLSALWKLRQIVRRHRIQLIHCNEQNCYPIGSYLARLTGLPIVVSVHFTMPRDFCTWAFGARCPDRIFFVSAGNLENCRPGVAGIIPESRWRVLNNAIDLSRYVPDPELGRQFRRRHSLNGRRLIGVACALRERKQVEHLFAAAAMLANDVSVVVAGGPVPEEQDYAESLVAEGRRVLGDRLVYVGHLQDLRPFCNALYLFVNTSREEAFGIGVVEAMACGCPVIGYPSKAVDGVVLPGGGEITPQDDIAALAEALNRWLGDEELIARTRLSARKRVESMFDMRDNCQALWSEYQSIVETPQNAAATVAVSYNRSVRSGK